MYYPKSQIVINLYTNGQEYVIKSTSENYIGNYWKTSDGKFFTGKTPEDKNIQELTIVTSTFSQNSSSPSYIQPIQVDLALAYDAPYVGENPDLYNERNILDYAKLKNIDTNSPPSLLLPSPFNPQPTQDDYALGEFTRYFCKKTNEVRYLEINKETYEKLAGQDPTYLWQVYTPFRYQWNISGEKEQVYSTNKKVTEHMITKFNLYSLNKFLKEDYLKFFKPSQSKNPSTSILNTNTLPTPQTNGGGYQGKELLS